MNVKICADSTCDLSDALLEQYGVTLAPLYVVMDDKPLKDRVEIVPEDIFRYVEKSGKLCRTAAVNVADYTELFGRFAKQYDAVIHVCISSDFSSCYQNACVAAQEFDNVYIVDSRNLSTGSGLLVIEAALRAAQGMEPQQIVTELNELAGRVEASFVVDNIEYLRKGGRCSSVAALGANLLRLKPCIEVTDGKMHAAKKYRGSLENCLVQYVKDRLSGRSDIVADRIFITHSTCAQQIVDRVRAFVEENCKFNEILETEAGCTISNHCGPGTLGVLFIRK